MKSNTLISVRSNCNFSLDYETGNLRPQAEIIIIATSPKYVLSKKKDSFSKEVDIHELRFIASAEGVNKLIGELQVLVKNINSFDQTAAAFNVIIEGSRKEMNGNPNQ